MFLILLKQSLWRSRRRSRLAILTVFLATSLISALLTVSIGVGDKMARELTSYGANILIEPASESLRLEIAGINFNPLAGRVYLDEAEVPNVKDIFWRNNIVGFAPLLRGRVEVGGQSVAIEGTFFDKALPVPDEDDYHTGVKIISPYWKVTGEWPQDERHEMLVGRQLGERLHWRVGDELELDGKAAAMRLRVSGVLETGAAEDDSLILPLAIAQQLLGLSGKVQQIRVSAQTVPENELSRRAHRNAEALNAEEYDRWYCTAYVSSIAHQLEEAVSGSVVRPIWQVAASEGVVIRKIELLLLVVTGAALIAAAMGIASLMTSSILDRSKEIALMKALGAESWQIHLLFYAEAALSASIGGLLGCAVGFLLARFVGVALFGQPLGFAWIVVPVVLVVAVLIALTGAVFPARRIARLYPASGLYGRV